MTGHLRRLLAAVGRLVRGPEQPLSPKARLGRKGERAAARFLQGKGYTVLERNFRTGRGEIDLIVFRDGTLAFVEVRSQTQPAPMDPLYTITRGKQRHIVKAAQAYCTARGPLPPDAVLRFDVVTVRFGPDGTEQGIRHVEGAFETTRRGFS